MIENAFRDPYHDILCQNDGSKWIAVARHKETKRINFYVSGEKMLATLDSLLKQLKEYKE